MEKPINMGRVEVICGPMFSGKTEELIRRLRRAVYAKQIVNIYKPELDNRYSKDEIVSHNKSCLIAQPIKNSEELLSIPKDITVVGIDEAQFFDSKIVNVVQQLANNNIRVILAGLDQDYQGLPFSHMPQLLAIADMVTKISAICVVCGEPATKTYRLIENTDKVLLGSDDIYEARCRKCHLL